MSTRKAIVLGGGGALAILLIAVIVGYATESHTTWPPSDASVKRMLLRLPYRFEFRAVRAPIGASGAVAGKVIGPHSTVVNFGIALGGEGRGVPVPHAGTLNASGGTAYVVTDDELIRGKREKFEPGKQFHTDAQWREAARMTTDIEETLCKARTGEPCPV